jgi:hypothetical protein
MLQILLKRVVILGALFVAIMFTCAVGARAQCACSALASVRVQKSSHVFTGEVLSVRKRAVSGKGMDYDRITVKVKEVWKGKIDNVVSVFNPSDYNGAQLNVGEDWVLFSTKDSRGRLIVDRDCCDWVEELKGSKARGKYQAISDFAGEPKLVVQNKD